MQFTDSFVLMLAIGLKIALLAFIFQDKLLTVLANLRAAKKNASIEPREVSTFAQKEQQNQVICATEPELDQLEQTKIDCSEEDQETGHSEDDSCIIEKSITDTSAQVSLQTSHPKNPQQSKKKSVSLVSLAKNIVAVSLLGANVNASAANKASSPLEGLARSDFKKITSLPGSTHASDYESLVKVMPCQNLADDTLISSEYGLLVQPVSELNSQMYKSKRATRLITKYIKHAQRKSDLAILKSKKRLMAGKLSKLTKSITKNRPRAFELLPILEESY